MTDEKVADVISKIFSLLEEQSRGIERVNTVADYLEAECKARLDRLERFIEVMIHSQARVWRANDGGK